MTCQGKTEAVLTPGHRVSTRENGFSGFPRGSLNGQAENYPTKKRKYSLFGFHSLERDFQGF